MFKDTNIKGGGQSYIIQKQLHCILRGFAVTVNSKAYLTITNALILNKKPIPMQGEK